MSLTRWPLRQIAYGVFQRNRQFIAKNNLIQERRLSSTESFYPCIPYFFCSVSDEKSFLLVLPQKSSYASTPQRVMIRTGQYKQREGGPDPTICWLMFSPSFCNRASSSWHQNTAVNAKIVKRLQQSESKSKLSNDCYLNLFLLQLRR